ADLAGDVCLARELQHLSPEGSLELFVLGDVGARIDALDLDIDLFALGGCAGAGGERAHGERLRRLPAVERIGVGAEQEEEVFLGEVDREARSEEHTSELQSL